MTATLVSKSAFAAIINVSPGRVSQFIAAGQISPAAIVGSGQRAKIDVDRAKADLRLTLDVAQRLGNGIDTRLDPVAPSAVPISAGAEMLMPTASAPHPTGGIDYEIKQQKLERERRANRLAAIEEARDRGQLIETDMSRAEMAKIAATMLNLFEGGLTDMASAVSAAFQLPERDVKHLLRAELRKVRESAARVMREKAFDLDEFSQVAIEAEDIITE